jgi:ribosomal protein S27AE
MKRETMATLSALVSIAAVSGFADPSGYVKDFNRRAGTRCPGCSKGKLVGDNGARYCQRCAYVEVSL